MTSLIHPDQSFQIWAVLVLATAFCVYGERKKWFGPISGVLMVILVMALIVSIGIVPSASDPKIEVPVYQFVFNYVVPLAIPLLLFNADIKRIIQESGRLLGLFLIGSFGVVLGALLASFIVPIGTETYKVTGTFIGTYTGGSVNFMAVASTLDFLQSPLFPATIAVDNVFTNLYIAFLFFMPTVAWLKRRFSSTSPAEDLILEPIQPDEAIHPLLESIAMVMAVSGIICGIGFWLAPVIGGWLTTDIPLDLLIISLITLIFANIFPNWFSRFEQIAYDVGLWLMYIFLGVIGAASNLREMFTATPSILIFAAITLFVHLVTILIGGKMLGATLEEIAIASTANAGGPSTAAPMAASFNMKKAVTPAVLIGVMGYVIGTFLGIAVGIWLK